MKIRSHLIDLVVASVLPVLVFSAIMTTLSWRQQRAAIEQRFLERVRAMSIALDRDLQGHIEALQVLAHSFYLQSGDLRGFYDQAAGVRAETSAWATIVLTDPGGAELMDLRRPFGAPPPKDPPDVSTIAAVTATGQPVVSRLVKDPVSGEHVTAVLVPVKRHGAVPYVLAAVIDQPSWLRFLSSYPVAPDATMLLLDQNRVVIARTLHNERSVGKPPAPTLYENAGRSPEGAYRAVGLEGQSFYAAHSRSPFSGWTVATGVPTAGVELALRGSTIAVVIGALAAGVLAFVLALTLGRRISAPIVSLASAAKAIGRGERPEIPRTTRVDEVGDLGRALEDAAAAVRAREETQGQLAAIVEGSGEAIISYTMDGIVLTWNPAATRLYGYTADESRGRHVSFLVPPERVHEPVEVFAAVERGESLTLETVRVRKDGTPVEVALAASPIRDAAGAVTGLSAAVRDITEQKRAGKALRESEERFATLAEVVPQLVWIAGADGGVEYFNRRWYDYTGRTAEQTLGSGWSQVVHPDEREGIWERWQRALRRGEPIEVEYRLQSADGRYQWFLGRGAPFRDADGRILKWFGTCTNIEGQKRAEEALRASDRAKDEFVAMLGHELRNPLGAIAGAVGLLNVLGKQEEPAVHARAVIGRQVEHLSRLVDDLLDVSRVTTGKVALMRQPLDLADLVATALSTWRSSGRLDRHQVTVDVVPAWVDADETRIEQILSNLVGNALKYTPAGGRVAVGSRPRARRRCWRSRIREVVSRRA